MCENKDFYGVAMPSEEFKILEFNKYEKFEKTPLIIYANLEYLIEKVVGCKTLKNHPQQK